MNAERSRRERPSASLSPILAVALRGLGSSASIAFVEADRWT